VDVRYISDANGNEVATLYATRMGDLENAARVLAAAPDLLEALQSMMRYYDTPAGPVDLLAQSRAAIDKAEGR
jgi:hypothetical protein